MAIRWRRARWYVFWAVLLAAAAVYAFRPQPVPVDVAGAVRDAMVVTIDGDGRTRVREVYVVSAPVSGQVLRIERHVGDAVVAGETVLATIRPTDPTFLDRRARAQAEATIKAAEAAFALAEAERARAEAELDFARSELDRSAKLAQRGTISQRELDRATLELRTREAALATAEATITKRRYELEMARAALIQPGQRVGDGVAPECCVEVFAPVDGRVLRMIQESEGVVLAGAPLLEVGNPADLEVVVDLLSADAVRVEVGAAATIDDWGGGDTLRARVRRVEPYGFTKVSALGIEEQRVNVILDLIDPAEQWRQLGHGFRVDVHIVVWHGEDVLQIPLGALFREGSDWAVFVLEEGRASLRRVLIGHSNGRVAEVLGGLSADELVILHPGDRVANGVRAVRRSAL